jgi:hypothetical protein
VREWIERHHPRLLGLWDWPSYRFVGRCWAMGCGRLMILHSPWRMFLCERTSMAISLTPEGEAYYQSLVIEEAERDFAA